MATLNKKQIMLLAVGGLGIYTWLNSKKDFKCPSGERAYAVNGKIVCESELSELGYFYYLPGVDDGRQEGYYHIDSWDTGFNLPVEAQTDWIQAATNTVLTGEVGSQLWLQAVDLLDNNFKTDSIPLHAGIV